jgi:hypothetical protein
MIIELNQIQLLLKTLRKASLYLEAQIWALFQKQLETCFLKNGEIY